MTAGRIRNAVIVAAGESTRLRPLTASMPKSLLPVDREVPMIERSVRQLRERGVDRIVVVVGFEQEQVRSTLGESVEYVTNPFFRHCNNAGSLWMARSEVGGGDFVYLHGDVVYEGGLLDGVLESASIPTVQLLVDFGPTDKEAMKVRLEGGCFAESSKLIPEEQASGEWTGIAGFSGGAAELVFETIELILMSGDLDAYDTTAFNRMAQDDVSFGLKPVGEGRWWEIDTPEDLCAARDLFREPRND